MSCTSKSEKIHFVLWFAKLNYTNSALNNIKMFILLLIFVNCPFSDDGGCPQSFPQGEGRLCDFDTPGKVLQCLGSRICDYLKFILW